MSSSVADPDGDIPGYRESARMLPDSLKVVTQNLWFDAHQRPERMQGHVHQWQQAQADIIAVQEATLACLRPLLQSDWLLQNFWTSVQLDDPQWQGVAVFSRIEPQRTWMTPLPGQMGRRLLQLDFPDLRLAVVHLESTSQGAEVRREQILASTCELARAPQVLWVGDFNMDTDYPENRALPADFVDLWPQLHPNLPGWTQDTDINTMMFKHFRKVKQVRYDRMLLRGSAWRPVQIDMLGRLALAPDLFASDHFGLCLELQRQAG